MSLHTKSRFFTSKRPREEPDDDTNSKNTYEISKEAAIHALKTLGKGHSEKVYENVMANFLYDRRIPTKKQARYFSTIDNNIVETGILDIEVDHCVLLELKVGHDTINADHRTQLRRYMRTARQHKPHIILIGAVFLFSKSGKLMIFKITDLPVI